MLHVNTNLYRRQGLPGMLEPLGSQSPSSDKNSGMLEPQLRQKGLRIRSATGFSPEGLC